MEVKQKPPAGELVTLWVNDRKVEAQRGESVASALLAAGYTSFRKSPEKGESRSPLCLMGVCFECLVEIDGVPGVRSCQTTVCEGMKVKLSR